ncbi:unnamed protein product, partial [marine sediment metagenome]
MNRSGAPGIRAIDVWELLLDGVYGEVASEVDDYLGVTESGTATDPD